MSKGRGAFFGPFLKEEIEKWLKAEKGRTNRELAAAADMTEQQLGQIKKHATKGGAEAALKLWKPLGYASFDALNAAAKEWWATPGRPPPRSQRAGRGEQPRLHQRPEWAEVLRQARAERPEIRDDDAWKMAGDIYDGEQFPRPLNSRIVGNLAYVWLVQISASGTHSAS